jgi:thymidylate kinase
MSSTTNFFVLEGMHGVGKSTTIKILKQLNYCVIEEDYLSLDNTSGLPLQSYTTRLYWMSKRMRKMAQVLNERFVFCDRSTMSSAIYSKHVDEMKMLYKACKKMKSELVETGAKIFTVLLWIDQITGWERVSKRLLSNKKKQKVREKLNEGSRDHYSDIWEKYDSIEFDHVIRTTGKTPREIATEIIELALEYHIESPYLKTSDSDDNSPCPIKMKKK